MMRSAMPLVDCHFHLFDAGAGMPSARYRPAYAARIEDWQLLLAPMGEPCGGVVVQTSFLGTDNSALLAALQALPGRLRGVAVVDPSVSDEALADMSAAGVRGIRLNLFDDPDWARIGTAPWRALFARVAALGWHVELHTGNGQGGALLAGLDAALGHCPAPVVLDHFGRPGEDGLRDAVFDVAARMLARRQVWVKLSAPYRLLPGADWRALARAWGRTVGHDRLLLGSDWPWTNHESAARADECAALFGWPCEPGAGGEGSDDRGFAESLRWRNAAALYGFDF
ncbi:2-pyrone-4,6-dicarboxylate hydrolase [Cupriavidus yeoncheonensis]|uniref:2-pyrone-4,6-dicarboxylate hydrolase n=1 Tax=Cupriavidus yeoncheonensis TaxID=1462994 RepID=A0A916IYU4_9BURK|nr:amidohydrolase family protein [Cupriavidus yeoncheonensis]CAG2154782.1 2-pyrone-4,6-dicarboxylate hydrolase [Cupriavidus yeoncheonensis]